MRKSRAGSSSGERNGNVGAWSLKCPCCLRAKRAGEVSLNNMIGLFRWLLCPKGEVMCVLHRGQHLKRPKQVALADLATIYQYRVDSYLVRANTRVQAMMTYARCQNGLWEIHSYVHYEENPMQGKLGEARGTFGQSYAKSEYQYKFASKTV